MGGDVGTTEQRPEFCLIRISGGTPRVLHIHSSLVNLKHKGIKAQERKN